MGKFSPMQIANAVAKKADKVERTKDAKKKSRVMEDDDEELADEPESDGDASGDADKKPGPKKKGFGKK